MLADFYQSPKNLQIASICMLFLSAITTFGTVKLIFWPTKNSNIDGPEIEKLPYQTETYYMAYKNNVDLGFINLDLDGSRYKIHLFNRSPAHFVLIINKKIAFIDVNSLIKKLNPVIAKHNCDGFMWFIIRLMDIGRLMPFNISIKKTDTHFTVDGADMSDKDFKMILRRMKESQVMTKKES
ncbi:hypothetical protein COBT_003719, partial [Conglomerata obtusa]